LMVRRSGTIQSLQNADGWDLLIAAARAVLANFPMDRGSS
jgi:hypothetical protein